MLVFCLLDDNVAREVRDMGIQLFCNFYCNSKWPRANNQEGFAFKNKYKCFYGEKLVRYTDFFDNSLNGKMG